MVGLDYASKLARRLIQSQQSHRLPEALAFHLAFAEPGARLLFNNLRAVHRPGIPASPRPGARLQRFKQQRCQLKKRTKAPFAQ